MRLFKLLFSVLLLTGLSYAINCNSPVSDEADVFGVQTEQVQQAVDQLIMAGVDPHIVSVVTTNGNPDAYEKFLEKTCSSWQAPNGGRKSTLLVLLVSPKERKMGVYYGSAWSKALDGSWNRIKQDYMFPRFKSGDYAGGISTAGRQFTERIKAWQDEAQHPVQTTVVNEAPKPTDWSGLWQLGKWFLGFITLACVGWLGFVLLRRRYEVRKELRDAQLRAQYEKSRASRVINILRIQDDLPAGSRKQFDAVYASYMDLTGRLGLDPDDSNLDLQRYHAIEIQYKKIADEAEELLQPTSASKLGKKVEQARREMGVQSPPKPVETPTGAESHPPTQEVRGGDVNITPVIIGNDFGYGHEREREPDPEPTRYREPEPEPAGGGSSSWGSSSSDSGGGGSSDWGSSSSSDSGGSSDFGGGSDSGGGGGSDSF